MKEGIFRKGELIRRKEENDLDFIFFVGIGCCLFAERDIMKQHAFPSA
jgi:hypothetical protein